MNYDDFKSLEPQDEDGNVLGFVYGTLRPGFGNHSFYEDCIVRDLGEGTIKGRLYARGIPFLDADGQGGTVRGSLLAYEPTHPRFVGLAHMEINAGYDWRIVTVTLDDGREVQAGVWHDDRASARGNFVPSGDYETYCLAHYGQKF